MGAAAGGGRRLAADAAPRGDPRRRGGPATGRPTPGPVARGRADGVGLAQPGGPGAGRRRPRAGGPPVPAAVALREDLAPLRRELVDALLAAGDGAQALAVIDAAPAEQRALGRLRLAEIRAALLTGDLDRAGRILEEGVVLPDVREGEPALHEVWFDYQVALAARDQRRPVDADLVAQVRATVPIPEDLDFRM